MAPKRCQVGAKLAPIGAGLAPDWCRMRAAPQTTASQAASQQPYSKAASQPTNQPVQHGGSQRANQAIIQRGMQPAKYAGSQAGSQPAMWPSNCESEQGGTQAGTNATNRYAQGQARKRRGKQPTNYQAREPVKETKQFVRWAGGRSGGRAGGRGRSVGRLAGRFLNVLRSSN